MRKIKQYINAIHNKLSCLFPTLCILCEQEINHTPRCKHIKIYHNHTQYPNYQKSYTHIQINNIHIFSLFKYEAYQYSVRNMVIQSKYNMHEHVTYQLQNMIHELITERIKETNFNIIPIANTKKFLYIQYININTQIAYDVAHQLNKKENYDVQVADITKSKFNIYTSMIMTNDERRERAENLITIQSDHKLKDTLILLDDVYTTGTTCNVVIDKIQKIYGQKKIYIITIAKRDERN